MVLFIISIFSIIIPDFEDNILDKKHEMIKELTNTSWSVLAKYHKEEQDSILTREEAQAKAISRIEYLRYGKEGKDYFWITDMEPTMIMHPYRSDLDNTNLSEYADPTGKKLFVEFVKAVEKETEGYVDYMWQWKDDSTRIVPKFSFVKKFEPWGWIIGTGIYIEDVKLEIASMEKRVIKISLIIIGIIIILLLVIAFQSLRIEKKRQTAETELLKSREQYKKLVETTNEGILMIINGDIIYSNKIVQNILNYKGEELHKKYFLNLLTETERSGTEGIRFFNNVSDNELIANQFNTQLIKKDGENIDVSLKVSKTFILNQTAYVIKIKEITDNENEIESTNRFKYLTDNINIGLFRTTLGRNGKFIETNNSSLEILGFKTEKELFMISILDLFHNKKDRSEFMIELFKNKRIKNKIIRLNKSGGEISTIAVSAVLAKNELGEFIYCDGVIEDITEQKSFEEKREKIITELQTSLLYFNQAVKHFQSSILSVNHNTSIFEASKIMTSNISKTILVSDSENNMIGIISDSDIKTRVVAKQLDYNEPLYKIMSSPIITISEKSLLFEAIVIMQETNISHLAVTDNENKITGIINNEELLQVIQYSSVYHLRRINVSTNIIELIEHSKRLPDVIKSLIEAGANSNNISKINASISDAIIKKLISFAIKEIGEAPVDFAFVVMGSEGREESTLDTDQDNAIIYIDDTNNEQYKQYFNDLGNKVCNWLNDLGYKFCLGNIMAKNPKYCQTLTVWKKYFTAWINTPNPQSIIDISIFFDIRAVYGNNKIVDQLRTHYFNLINSRDVFFYHLAENIINSIVPVNILSKSNNTFDIKKVIFPVTGLIRVYALKHNIIRTNTIQRLDDLLKNNYINKDEHNKLFQLFSYLMLMRYKHQSNRITQNKEANNLVDINNLTELEINTVKKKLIQINEFKTKLNFDFKAVSF